ncbi:MULTISPECIES: JAB domain-containing protein [Aerococcus]|uniref:JAB domain-containing protein n=1 Tax=Aerococcus TaxID=1375 RepID=UPI0018A70C57|nr:MULTISPECIES: JAB domain-containing protein [Aerococcus]MCY3067595.1 hypothetical protein [Aerococcus mictus]MCY3080870.1 hypothetical protein [Aerococcus mictus]MDK8485475.1 JAB domain-containing protein [Aerococcus urinae]
MEHKDVYEYFNCRNQEELYSKIKTKDPDVDKLYEFYSDYQTEIQKGKFEQPEDYANDIIKQRLIPPENTFTVVSVNTKNQPIKYTNYSFNTDYKEFKEIFEKSYIGSTDRFVYFSRNDRPKEETLIDRYISLTRETFDSYYGLKSLDHIKITGNGSFYTANGQRFLKCERAKAKDSAKENSEVYTQPVTIQQEIENLPEFSKYYANEELKGKNVIYDRREIEHLLQIGYSDLSKEHCCLINYNTDYDIKNVEVISIGLLNQTFSKPAINVRNAPNKDNGGAILMHNHPSGYSDPSPNDIDNAVNNYYAFKTLDKELFDVYVIGKDKVFSFANDGYSLSQEFEKMKINQYEVEEQLNDNFMKENSMDTETNDFKASEPTESYEQMALFEKQMQYYYDDEYEI